MPSKLASGVLAADVAAAGTFTVSYPARGGFEAGVCDEGDFFLAMAHELVIGSGNALTYPEKFDITLGTASITVTNNSGAT